MTFRLRRFRRMQQRRLIAAMIALAVLVGSLPLQLSIAPAKDLSKPFPCQTRACGCRSAEQCAKKCCCFTAAQKQAWALKQRIASKDDPQPQEKVGPDSIACCKPKADEIRDTDARAESGAERCRLPKCTRSIADRPATGSKRFQVVVTTEARNCGGLLPLWLTLGDVCLPESPAALGHEFLPIGRIEPRTEVRSDSDLAPPVPPPRIGGMPGSCATA